MNDFVKFKLELLADPRFTDKLDDEGKLVYMGILLLSGLTNNKIPFDCAYIKRTLNLHFSIEKINEKITQIRSIFPKFVVIKNGEAETSFISFKNFENVHETKDFKRKERKESNKEKKEKKSHYTSYNGVGAEIAPNSHVHVSILLQEFCSLYKQKTDRDYVVNYAKDYSLMKRLLSSLGFEEVRARIQLFFTINDNFIKQAGYSVGIFSSMINRLIPKNDEVIWNEL